MKVMNSHILLPDQTSERVESMRDVNLKKTSRKELLEIFLEQGKYVESLESEIETLKGKLSDQELLLKNAGSIAEASLRLSGVFEAAQRAADIYLEAIKKKFPEEDLTETAAESNTK